MPESKISLGGVDPLGLRQINFDLMDHVFPGLNNVARHVRPFVVVAWAWRRGREIAQASGSALVKPDDLRDFVDRVEVLYVWSQMVHPDGIEVDLPGRQVLSSFMGRDRYLFGGDEWQKRRENRADSTGLMAAINYGPALKSMQWVTPNPENPTVFNATEIVEPALAAFQEAIGDFLDHAAFSRFGPVEVSRDEVVSWSDAWRIDRPTEQERIVAASVLAGENALLAARRRGFDLMLAAKRALGPASDVTQVRKAMIGALPSFAPQPDHVRTLDAWRRTQVRQLFRLALEAMLYWAIRRLIGTSPQTTASLVDAFLDALEPEFLVSSTNTWFEGDGGVDDPLEAMEAIQKALGDTGMPGLEKAIMAGLGVALREAPHQPSSERADRLPTARARQECLAWGPQPLPDFVAHILTNWIFAQHVYWSVGRGLADARGNGRRLLRLKIVLDEGGWAPAPGVTSVAVPLPTADRLNSALTLAGECGLFDAT
jgi:hypothetical protein